MDDTCVIVTGASRGLGASVARAFGEEGASVVGCSRDFDSLCVPDVREGRFDRVAVP